MHNASKLQASVRIKYRHLQQWQENFTTLAEIWDFGNNERHERMHATLYNQ